MKKIILFYLMMFAPLIMADSNVTSYGSSLGRGQTKVEAYAQAVGRVPGNAITIGVSYAGYSSKTGNKLDYGSYRCIIRWKIY